MVLVTKQGFHFNDEKIWAIEYATEYEDGKILYWSYWKKYKTQLSMIQAFNDLKDKGWSGSVNRGGRRMKFRTIYRMVHVYYDHLYEDLNKESMRKWKISKLLNKNEK